MSRRPLLYAVDGSALAYEKEPPDLKTAALLAAFGAIKGLLKTAQGVRWASDEDELEEYRERVAVDIVGIVGREVVERCFGIKLAAVDTLEETAPTVMAKEPKGVQ